MNTEGAVPSPTQPLSDWLAWLETIHPVSIDMGLDRVSRVADRLALRPARKPLILVGGTNGKGSTVAMLNAIYQSAGYKVGAYTSPHIQHFCERICVDGQPVAEQAVIDALAYIEAQRAPDTLTYFEYTTLAAMRVFNQLDCDVLLIEVGLGGRLDATNIWDADCSIITSIALDHEEYLGSDVSVIATEKAAIGRHGRPFIVGDASPPASLGQYVKAHGFMLVDVGSQPVSELPQPSLPGDYQRRNAACAKAAVQALQERLPVSANLIASALAVVRVPGRFEQLQVGGVPVVLDVAHNPAGAQALVSAWQEQQGAIKCDLLFATLGDKDIDGVIASLAPIVQHWHCVTLDVPRAKTAAKLAEQVSQVVHTSSVTQYNAIPDGASAALASAHANHRPLLVAGSFYTIAAVQPLLLKAPAMTV